MTKERKSYARHRRGKIAESLAQNMLIKNGLRLITRNYRSKLGEIDLIFLENGLLIFIEVRARANANFAFPTDTVDYYKQKKIIRTAEFFLLKHSHYAKLPCRFDVIGVDFSFSPPHMEWIKGAFIAT